MYRKSLRDAVKDDTSGDYNFTISNIILFTASQQKVILEPEDGEIIKNFNELNKLHSEDSKYHSVIIK